MYTKLFWLELKEDTRGEAYHSWLGVGWEGRMAGCNSNFANKEVCERRLLYFEKWLIF